MARADEEAIETFMSITGVSEPVAIQKLTEHAGNLNEAINAHFAEGDGNITNEAAVVPQVDLMDVDDPVQHETHQPPFSLLPSPGLMNPFSLLDRDIRSSIFDRVPSLVSSMFDRVPNSASRAPFVSHPREVREIPIEVKDGNEQSSHSDSGHAPTIQDVTGNADDYGPEIHGTVIIDEEDAEVIPIGPTARLAPGGVNDSVLGGYPDILNSGPSAPGINNMPVYSNDIEEEMIRAAIEASKQDTISGQSESMPQQSQSEIEDPELAQAVSLSLKTADQEKASRELGDKGQSSELVASTATEMEVLGKLASSGRLEAGGCSMRDKNDEGENQPLVRHRISPSSTLADTGEEIDCTTPSNPRHRTINTSSQHNESVSHLNEWGGISSSEHDEAVMLEAALFGGVPEGSAYHVPHALGQFRQNGLGETDGSYPRNRPRPPSPSLTAQRLIREQQDDEYFASLQADREKELKAKEEAEIRRLEEQAATESALIEERQKQEESLRKSEEHQELERHLASKEASLPNEPSPDDGSAINLLVRMPDGSRQSRRFLKSHKLQHLFDFIDVGRVVRPGTYRLVRPYPRRAFSVGESAATFDELGLSGRQDALFLELI